MISMDSFIIVLILSAVISDITCHIPQNTSDVLIYRDHPENGQETVFYTTEVAPTTTVHNGEFIEQDKEKESQIQQEMEQQRQHEIEHQRQQEMENQRQQEMENQRQKEMEQRAAVEKEEIVFIPTESPFNMDAGGIHEDIRIADVMDNKKAAMPSAVKTTVPAEQESILFIEGKNDERQERPWSEETKKPRRRYNMNDEEYLETTTKKKILLDCVNLNCDNTIASVCGAKLERKEWKYRLFLNECYFRKVNCMFNYESNRYVQVELTFCKNADLHEARRNNKPYQYQPYVYHPMTDTPKKKNIEVQPRPGRRMETRRAMAMDLTGGYCGHICPTTCTDSYKPECGLNMRGERRTFTNHCHLDRVSCRTNTVWRRRPLAECVGGKKADMHQNRAFIGWMQKAGIVDNRGRMKLDS